MSDRGADEPGVLVTGVVANSPASKAGLAANDVIVLVDGEPIHAPIDVSVVVQRKPVGTHVIVSGVRGNQFRQFDATLEAVAPPSQLLRNQLVGKSAPPWVGIAAAPNQPVPTLDQYRGRPLVLMFWRPECGQCPKVVAAANQWHVQHRGRLHVLGVASIAPSAIAAESTRLGVGYPSISDPQGLVALGYGAINVPLCTLIDATGVIRDVFLGAGAEDIGHMQRTIASLLGS
jgi:peroxiredoxin